MKRMKPANKLVPFVLALGVLIALPQLSFAGSKEISELSQKAIEACRAGRLDEAAKLVIDATRMRQTMAKGLPSTDRSNTDGFASSQLETAFQEVANGYTAKSRWADLITFAKWHLSDSGHLGPESFVTAYAVMGDAYRGLNNYPESEKAYKLAMGAYESGRTSMTADQINHCKRMLPGYARVLKLQNKEREAQDVTAKIAR